MGARKNQLPLRSTTCSTSPSPLHRGVTQEGEGPCLQSSGTARGILAIPIIKRSSFRPSESRPRLFIWALYLAVILAASLWCRLQETMAFTVQTLTS